METSWRSVGIERVDGNTDRVPPFDPVAKRHLWTMMAVFEFDPDKAKPDETPLLGPESMLVLQGPGCLYCGETWSKQLARKPCAADLEAEQPWRQ